MKLSHQVADQLLLVAVSVLAVEESTVVVVVPNAVAALAKQRVEQ